MKYVKMYNISIDKLIPYFVEGLDEKQAIVQVLAAKDINYLPDDFDFKKFKCSYHIYIKMK